jgi:hypothetical protein
MRRSPMSNWLEQELTVQLTGLEILALIGYTILGRRVLEQGRGFDADDKPRLACGNEHPPQARCRSSIVD